MSYRVEFTGDAVRQASSPPANAFNALVARVLRLIEEPWDATVRLPGSDPMYRETTFGAGIMGFRVDESAQLIEIYDLVWAG